jgi:hypothetical protein
MVVATGIIGAYLVVWANSSFALQKADISDQTSDRINMVKEDLVIEDVWFYTSGSKYMNVTIRNTGDLAIKVTKIYVNNSQVWSAGQDILIDQKKEIRVQKDWFPGAPQNIWIQTERGNNVKQLWKS